jgi:hypothetical protein
MDRMAPSARLEAQIAELLTQGWGPIVSDWPSWVGWVLGWCCSG